MTSCHLECHSHAKAKLRSKKAEGEGAGRKSQMSISDQIKATEVFWPISA